MLAAQIKGKLTRKEEDLEDLLTSNVFGSIKYVTPENGLIPLLSAAEDLNGKYPLKDISQISTVDYEFWPLLNEENCNRCEPDVLIHVTHTTGTKTIILVEAKYKSGKSSEADDGEKPNDQLAREWDNLSVLARRKDLVPILIYITADFNFPNTDVEEAQFETKKKHDSKIDIAWISWRKLSVIFEESNYDIINDLVTVLQRQWLIFFEGISVPDDFEPISWRFQIPPIKLNLSFKFLTIQWKYNYNTLILFDWDSFMDFEIIWRFINE